MKVFARTYQSSARGASTGPRLPEDGGLRRGLRRFKVAVDGIYRDRRAGRQAIVDELGEILSAAHRGKAPARRVLPWDSIAAFWPLDLPPSGRRFVRATFGGAA
jgi:hypothetical protein